MSESSQPIPVFGWANAAPTATTEYHQAGEILLNPSPFKGEAVGYVCEAAGFPGTWRAFGYIDGGSATLMTAAAQVLPYGNSLVLISLASGANTLTLAPAGSHAAGFKQVIKNLDGDAITVVSAAGATYNDAAAITLAEDASVTIIGDGTTWYKAD